MPNNSQYRCLMQLDEMQTLQPEIPKRPEWMFVVQLINISDVYGEKSSVFSRQLCSMSCILC